MFHKTVNFQLLQYKNIVFTCFKVLTCEALTIKISKRKEIKVYNFQLEFVMGLERF